MRVRITPLDGKLPNLALMRIAAWERESGSEVHWHTGTARQFGEPDYERVYASAIFATSAKAVDHFRKQWPQAIIGGSGGDSSLRVESIVPSQFTGLDYSGYPEFTASIGYTMRGCRFKCGFCIVPKQEGAARSERTVAQIWRGEEFPKNLHLLDNDFFGNPDWRERVAEIRDGDFKVCINQGINVRLVDEEQAEAVASIRYKDDQFKRPRLYTAWDNIGDEKVFFAGVDRLERAGVRPDHIMTYMLVGYDRRETWERLLYRFNRMVERGIRPYPMVHDKARLADEAQWLRLKRFQRWAITGAHKVAPFSDYSTARRDAQPELFAILATTTGDG